MIYVYLFIFGFIVGGIKSDILTKIAILAMFVFYPYVKANAETYHYKNGMVIQAQDYKSAAKYCFQIMTKGVYSGESRGLEIIDMCANPIKGKIK